MRTGINSMNRLPVLMLLMSLPFSYGLTQQRPLSDAQKLQQTCYRETMASTTPSSRFQTHDDGTVTDKETGLMWRVCVEGLKGKNCEKGRALELSWGGALNYVPGLNSGEGFAGHKDWRLPNIRELGSLIELQCAKPAINSEIFPNTPSAHAWSASPYHFYTHYSWYADFGNGQLTYAERIKPKLIRLVRGGN